MELPAPRLAAQRLSGTLSENEEEVATPVYVVSVLCMQSCSVSSAAGTGGWCLESPIVWLLLIILQCLCQQLWQWIALAHTAITHSPVWARAIHCQSTGSASHGSMCSFMLVAGVRLQNSLCCLNVVSAVTHKLCSQGSETLRPAWCVRLSLVLCRAHISGMPSCMHVSFPPLGTAAAKGALGLPGADSSAGTGDSHLCNFHHRGCLSCQQHTQK